MDIILFTKMLKDKHFCNLKKLKYKYGAVFDEFLRVFSELYLRELPLEDFSGQKIVFAENLSELSQNAIKLLLKSESRFYGIKAAEEEIISTCAIENIDFSRDSVRNILKGYAPKDEEENRILGIKKGIEFISDTNNKITEENLHKLYMMSVGSFLTAEDRLNDGSLYRHDAVFVVDSSVEHTGADHKKVPEMMKALIEFINADDSINDLIKAAIIHFCFSFIHPYFDGNGRTARLVHLWFLIQKGYQYALFIPFSQLIEKSRKEYYDAFTLIEENKRLSGRIDVTPFILYFIENIYNRIKTDTYDTITLYNNALTAGSFTSKEKALWQFVVSFYGTDEFSTKQLEKDYGNAAYATIRSFVIKFTELGIFTAVKYGTRTKYKITQ